MNMEKGQLIVLSGPSGSGKSTVIKKLMEKRGNIHFSVSYTTRQPREGEIDGVSYNFVDRAEFERMIKNDEFLEHAEYSGNCYGTSLKVIEEKQAAGKRREPLGKAGVDWKGMKAVLGGGVLGQGLLGPQGFLVHHSQTCHQGAQVAHTSVSPWPEWGPWGRLLHICDAHFIFPGPLMITDGQEG